MDLATKKDFRKEPRHEDFASRFWAKVEKGDGCWRWLGSTDSKGYGHVRLQGGRMQQAHRTAWELTTGKKLSPHVKLCHHCDNPACVRPDHMFPGTQAQNLADMRAKGRSARGARNRAARLSESQVLDIRASFAQRSGYGAQQDLARLYGVTLATINDIVRGRTWQHVGRR